MKNKKNKPAAGKEMTKTRAKKCLNCFKNTTGGKKSCEHCGFKFKSFKNNWRIKLKGFFRRLVNG